MEICIRKRKKEGNEEEGYEICGYTCVRLCLSLGRLII